MSKENTSSAPSLNGWVFNTELFKGSPIARYSPRIKRKTFALVPLSKKEPVLTLILYRTTITDAEREKTK